MEHFLYLSFYILILSLIVLFYTVCFATLIYVCKIVYKIIKSKLNIEGNAKLRLASVVVMNIVNFFKFVFIAIGHPFVFWVYHYLFFIFFIKYSSTSPPKIFGYEIYSNVWTYSNISSMYKINVVFFVLFALLFYAGWLVMLTCILKK